MAGLIELIIQFIFLVIIAAIGGVCLERAAGWFHQAYRILGGIRTHPLEIEDFTEPLKAGGLLLVGIICMLIFIWGAFGLVAQNTQSSQMNDILGTWVWGSNREYVTFYDNGIMIETQDESILNQGTWEYDPSLDHPYICNWEKGGEIDDLYVSMDVGKRLRGTTHYLVSSGWFKKSTSEPDILGTWDWRDGHHVTFYSDGTVESYQGQSLADQGTWDYNSSLNYPYTLHWSNAPTDKLFIYFEPYYLINGFLEISQSKYLVGHNLLTVGEHWSKWIS